MQRLEQSTEDEVQSTFSSIVGQKEKKKKVDNQNAGDTSVVAKGKKRKAAEESENQTARKKASKMKENQDYRDKDFYIPYTKDNVFAEDG